MNKWTLGKEIGVLIAREFDVTIFFKDLPNFMKDVPNFVNDVPRVPKFISR